MWKKDEESLAYAFLLAIVYLTQHDLKHCRKPAPVDSELLHYYLYEVRYHLAKL
jgi:hypothetical protein